MWIRSREVKFVLPQRVSVLELECICNLLFFKDTEASTKFSCNISVFGRRFLVQLPGAGEAQR